MIQNFNWTLKQKYPPMKRRNRKTKSKYTQSQLKNIKLKRMLKTIIYSRNQAKIITVSQLIAPILRKVKFNSVLNLIKLRLSRIQQKRFHSIISNLKKFNLIDTKNMF